MIADDPGHIPHPNSQTFGNLVDHRHLMAIVLGGVHLDSIVGYYGWPIANIQSSLFSHCDATGPTLTHLVNSVTRIKHRTLFAEVLENRISVGGIHFILRCPQGWVLH